METKGNSILLVVARRLEGKVALVIGGATSIGECIARSFCNQGAKVIIADIQDDFGRSVAQDLKAEVAIFVHCDVTVESNVQKVVDTTISIFEKLDIMVNNAGVIDPHRLSIINNDIANFEHVVKVNFIGVFLCTKHTAWVMILALQGSIITLGTISSSIGGVASHGYMSTKHGTVGLAKNVASELGKFGIRVNCLSLYFIESPLTLNFFKMDEDAMYGGVYSNLEGVKLRQEDVVDAAIYLGSDESKYVSRHNLALDGGFTTINPVFGLFSR